MVMVMGGMGPMVVFVGGDVIIFTFVIMSAGFAFGVIMATGLGYCWGAETGRLIMLIAMMGVVVVVIMTAAGFSFSMVMTTVVRDGAHLPIEEAHDAEEEAADQHLNAEAALAG